jgi:hypothetical protein
VPERKKLLEAASLAPADNGRAVCRQLLEKAGFAAALVQSACDRAVTHRQLYRLQRLARLAEQMKQEQVMPHVATATLRPVLESDFEATTALELMDWCEIAVEVCRYKRQAGQQMRNAAGLLVKIAKDPESQQRLVSPEIAASYRQRFQDQEQAALRRAERDEERQLILAYEEYRQQRSREIFDELSEPERDLLRKEKLETLRQHGRLEKISAGTRELELEQLVLQALAKKEVPPFERWKLRSLAGQAVFPFTPDAIGERTIAVETH